MRDNRARTVALVRVVDGDTFVARAVDLWPGTQPRYLGEAAIRVRGWSADELNTVEGPVMRDKFAALLVAAQNITLVGYTMSFQRLVADVYIDGQLFAGVLRQVLEAVRRAEPSV